MRIKLISVGKIKFDYLNLGIEDYQKRIESYFPLEIIEVMDEKTPTKATEKEEEKIKDAEGAKILAKIKEEDYVIACDLNGKQFDSLEFASHLEDLLCQGKTTITVVIGGSLGLSAKMKSRANERLTLSKMTFPHQLTKLIVLEQIYRACKIMKNEVYHK